MKYDFSFSEADFITVVAILCPSVSFILYWFIFNSEKLQQHFHGKFQGDQGKIFHILFIKYVGLILLGLFPWFIFALLLPDFVAADYGLSFSKGTHWISLNWIAALSPIILTMNWFAAKRKKTFSLYPQIRIAEWDMNLIIQYSTAWTAYLFGYELLFRGFLFFPLVQTIGIWPAIAVNIALYSVSHIPKGMDETVGALVLGLILCLATLQTETIWVAFVVHVVLALSNSLFALRNNPDMRIVNSRSHK